MSYLCLSKQSPILENKVHRADKKHFTTGRHVMIQLGDVETVVALLALANLKQNSLA